MMTEKDKSTPGIAPFAKGGEVKKYMGGSSVNKNKNRMLTTKGWGSIKKNIMDQRKKQTGGALTAGVNAADLIKASAGNPQ